MIRYKEKVARYAVTLLLLSSAVQFLGIGNSYAEDTRVRKKFKDKIMVVQPKTVLQKKRVEVVPTFRLSINDAIVDNYSAGVEINYHILESLYIGVGFDWSNFGSTFGGLSPTFSSRIGNRIGIRPDGIKLNYFAFGKIAYVPIMGKMAAFNSAIGYYDISVALGGGYLNYKPLLDNEKRSTGGGFLELNARIFLTDWLAFNFSVRELLFFSKFKADSKAKPTNVVSAGVGLSFYIPFGFEYSEPDLKGEGSLNLAKSKKEK